MQNKGITLSDLYCYLTVRVPIITLKTLEFQGALKVLEIDFWSL